MSVDTSFRCSSCASVEFGPLRQYRGSAPGFTGKTLIRCGGCGLVTVHPLPTDEELERYYDSYWEDRADIKRLDKLAERAGARARFLAPHLPDRNSLRVVDVGAGLGQIYTALVALGSGRRVEYDAVEVDPDAVQYLTETLRARVVRSRIEDCQGPYDLMVMSHFLEHLPDPVAYLRAQRVRMERDGLLFAEVPNGDHRFKDHDQPHLSFFEIDTLAGVVESAGLEVLRIDTCGAEASEVGRTRSGKPKKSGERRALWRRAKSALKKRIRSWNPEKLRKKQDPNLESYGGDRRWLRVIAAVRSP